MKTIRVTFRDNSSHVLQNVESYSDMAYGENLVINVTGGTLIIMQDLIKMVEIVHPVADQQPEG